jgi:FAD dependent oxidoreductase TIGR03364
MTLPSADVRDFELLDPAGLRRVNPALGGELMGGLWCRRDAAVEPRGAQSAIRERMLAKPGYQWLPGREVRQVEPQLVLDDHGEAHRGDLVIVCTGAWFGGLIRELAPDLPLRRVRLQMMQTEPLDQALTTAVADGDSFRYYPAFRTETLDADQPQTPVAAEHHMQLLMVQRNDGGLTIGDTHAYDEPFDFDVDEDPYRHLVSVAEALLGRPVPAVSRRWAGVYAQTLDRSLIVHRSQVRPGVWLVTGPGGRGMTCSPAIAEATLEEAGF